MRNVEGKLYIDGNVSLVHQKHPKIPFDEHKRLKACVESLPQQDIIDPAVAPSPWVSSVVLVPEPKQPGSVRLCVDMRQANNAISRE